ncbi:MAG: ABC transporter permease [Defluviitaleaceae bacterium]|nr:ABC transporter permease [Defluviitaleaceae bacterium]
MADKIMQYKISILLVVVSLIFFALGFATASTMSRLLWHMILLAGLVAGLAAALTGPESTKDFVRRNKVVILFAAITVFAFLNANTSPELFFSELFTRFGRNTFIVLSLLIPVVAGLGLNFGIVIGAMSAQVAIFLAIVFGGVGFWGLMLAVIIATPLAMLLGYSVGRLFNGMKGSEMIGGMIAGIFYDGFYQFLFLWVFGGLIPLAMLFPNTAPRMMVGDGGVGVVSTIDLGQTPNYFRQAFDNVPMLSILQVMFFAMLAFVVIGIIINLAKKQDFKQGLLKPMVVLAVLAVGFGLSFIPDINTFLNQPRLAGIYALRLVFIVTVLMVVYRYVMARREGKPFNIPKHVFYLVLATAVLAFTLPADYSLVLRRVQIAVLPYMMVGGLCFGITWFLKTKLGQNMRTVGHNRAVATAAGINVNRTRIIAMMMSTVLASWGQIIFMQNIGLMTTYGGHQQVGFYAIAALLVGGATVSKASVKHAILGVFLFHAMFILAPPASIQLTGSAGIGEYSRVIAGNAVIALALIMHVWTRVKKTKKDKAKPPEAPPAAASEPAAEPAS